MTFINESAPTSPLDPASRVSVLAEAISTLQAAVPPNPRQDAAASAGGVVQCETLAVFQPDEVGRLADLIRLDRAWSRELEKSSAEADRSCDYSHHDERSADYGEWCAESFASLIELLATKLGLTRQEA